MISWEHNEAGRTYNGRGPRVADRNRPEHWSARVGELGVLTIIRRSASPDSFEVVVFGRTLLARSPSLADAQARARRAAATWARKAVEMLDADDA